MYWSPFVSHHKPKLQVNIETGNEIVGYLIKVDTIFSNYLRIGDSRTHCKVIRDSW